MKLKDYIKGRRKGREANKIERHSLQDPLLQEAIEGYDSVEGDHTEALSRLENRLEEKLMQERATKKGRSRVWRAVAVAASLLLVVGVGGYFLFNQLPTPDTTIAMADSGRVESIDELEDEDLDINEVDEELYLAQEEQTTIQFTPPAVAYDSDLEESQEQLSHAKSKSEAEGESETTAAESRQREEPERVAAVAIAAKKSVEHIVSAESAEDIASVEVESERKYISQTAQRAKSLPKLLEEPISPIEQVEELESIIILVTSEQFQDIAYTDSVAFLSSLLVDILNEDKTPIEGALLTVEESGKSAKSNFVGRVNLVGMMLPQKIVVTKEGYESYTAELDMRIKKERVKKVEIILKRE